MLKMDYDLFNRLVPVWVKQYIFDIYEYNYYRDIYYQAVWRASIKSFYAIKTKPLFRLYGRSSHDIGNFRDFPNIYNTFYMYCHKCGGWLNCRRNSGHTCYAAFMSKELDRKYRKTFVFD
jgi:hypothetical protein